jgi:ATP-dependent DNA helicase RecG
MGTNAQIESFIAGDVGSGKTIVALWHMLLTQIEACLAPTRNTNKSALYRVIRIGWKERIIIKLLTGSGKTAGKSFMKRTKTIYRYFDTCLIRRQSEISELGLSMDWWTASFWGEQRSKLWKKKRISPRPPLLSENAGDEFVWWSWIFQLLTSYLRTKPIKPCISSSNKSLKFIQESGLGDKYICLSAESAERKWIQRFDGWLWKRFKDFPLPDYSISILHGKMKPAEKMWNEKRFLMGKLILWSLQLLLKLNVPMLR